MLSLRRCWVEIDLGRIAENYRICMAQLPEGCRAIAVVKADAYGHGDKEVAAALQATGCRDFAVSNANEAQNLREAGVTGSILVLGYTPVDMAQQLLRDDIMQTIVSEEYAQRLAQTGIPVKCQWAIDTGMNRMGLDGDDPEHCEKLIRDYKDRLHTVGMFTHLSAADEEDEGSAAFTRGQIEKFAVLARGLSDLKLPFVHCMNSAGGLRYMAECDDRELFDFCRLGIVMYGLRPNYAGRLPAGLRPALTWKSVISMIKDVHRGEAIGYGRTYTCEHDMRIATVQAGYADGYPRLLSNRGCVLIRGSRAPIVGNICMDQMMVDITDIPDVRVDDEVVLLGESGDLVYTADDMAHTIGTIGYEIVCGISKRTERRYV